MKRYVTQLALMLTIQSLSIDLFPRNVQEANDKLMPNDVIADESPFTCAQRIEDDEQPEVYLLCLHSLTFQASDLSQTSSLTFLAINLEELNSLEGTSEDVFVCGQRTESLKVSLTVNKIKFQGKDSSSSSHSSDCIYLGERPANRVMILEEQSTTSPFPLVSC